MTPSIGVLLTIALGKILTTSLTIGSGGSGGVFGPSMVIGACLGAAVGSLFNSLLPEIVREPRVYVVVGMAGFFAGIAHAPFSTIVMVSEMTGDYKLLLASMWVCTLSFLFCRRWTLYDQQVPTRLDSLAHRGDYIVDVLAGIKVRDAFHPLRAVETVSPTTTLKEIVKVTLPKTKQRYFPVLDANGKLVGVFSEGDLRSSLHDENAWQVAIAGDIMVTEYLSLTPDDDLNTALRRFTEKNVDELPVVDDRESLTFLGMLRRKETIAFYNRRLEELKHESP